MTSSLILHSIKYILSPKKYIYKRLIQKMRKRMAQPIGEDALTEELSNEKCSLLNFDGTTFGTYV